MKECKFGLNNLGNSNRVFLLWVPGHQIEGNEKPGWTRITLFVFSTNRKRTPFRHFSIRMDKSNKRKLSSEHEKLWLDNIPRRGTYQILPYKVITWSGELLNLSRQMKRGLGFHNQSLNLLNTSTIVNNPKVHAALAEETGFHITSVNAHSAPSVDIIYWGIQSNPSSGSTCSTIFFFYRGEPFSTERSETTNPILKLHVWTEPNPQTLT